MARERMIYPEMLDSDSFQSLSSDGKVLFYGLLLLADDHGRGKVCEEAIKGRVFPKDKSVTPKMVGEILEQFVRLDFIRIADHGLSRHYYWINWDLYQHLKYKKDSKIPEFPGNLGNFSPISPQISPQVILGKDGMGEDGTRRDVLPTSPKIPPKDLEGLKRYAADPKLCEKWEDLKAEWTGAYPGVDIVAEVRRAHAWETSDPKHYKTSHAAFLNNWLKRAQDNANRTGPIRQKTEKETIEEMFK